MGRPKRDPNLGSEMQARAIEWAQFREANMLSQKLLSELTGICRRAIQSVEAGKTIPQKRHLDAFDALVKKYLAEDKPTGQEKSRIE